MNSATAQRATEPLSEPIAIVGMSCIFPGASSLGRFWENITNGVDSVREVSALEWDASVYREREGFGKVYCTRGGFITELANFDPLEFGIMPASVNGADPDQYLALRAAAEALRDAGYQPKTFDGEKADIVIGRTMAPGAGSLNLIQHGQTVDQVLRVLQIVCPRLDGEQLTEIGARLKHGLKPCTSDTIPAVMPNVLSGRIANKLGFRGRNLVLDAACASSLVAVETGIERLSSGQSDLVLAGGIHVNSHPYFYQMFCELGALSPSGRISPFDDNADGTILGEGVGMIVLKRLRDATADKNRVYATIRGIGSSSDGRGGGSLAPNQAGEALAMERAYSMAGISPQTVQLLEAHGTGTKLGDLVEMKAIQQVFASAPASDSPSVPIAAPWCAVGSVKSMIGHTQAASGVAGLIKVALALFHRVLPPTLNVMKPNSQIDWASSPCYINSRAREWVALNEGAPRRGAVSAFGFGGVNAHAVLEEHHYVADFAEQPGPVRSFAAGNRLCLRYPELKLTDVSGLGISTVSAPCGSVNLASSAPVCSSLQTDSFVEPWTAESVAITTGAPVGQDGSEWFVHTYLQNIGAFQQNILDVQQTVILKYLRETSEDS